MSALLFHEDLQFDLRFRIFQQSPLGQLYQAIPFKELAKQFKPFKSCKPQGRKSRLSFAGGLGLMFLKHYLGLSDAKLMDRLNSDWKMQMFCGTLIPLNNPIRDIDLPGRWRRFFAEHIDLDSFQDSLAEYWKPYIKNTQVLMDPSTPCFKNGKRKPINRLKSVEENYSIG